MNYEQNLRRIRWMLGVFIVGLFLSGVTAIPLVSEVNWLVKVFEPVVGRTAVLGEWLIRVRDALQDTEARHAFLFYGTDWLAFGHIVIAVAFIGAWRDPVKNAWLFDFGLIACVMVIPWAMILGAVRGIPLFWRMIDCSFGVFGFVPLWFCRRWTKELESSLAPAKR